MFCPARIYVGVIGAFSCHPHTFLSQRKPRIQYTIEINRRVQFSLLQMLHMVTGVGVNFTQGREIAEKNKIISNY